MGVQKLILLYQGNFYGDNIGLDITFEQAASSQKKYKFNMFCCYTVSLMRWRMVFKKVIDLLLINPNEIFQRIGMD